MDRRTARIIHRATNMAYWVENPDWHTGNRLADAALATVRSLHPNIHQRLKQRFFDTDRLIAVNGESVVVRNGSDKVDKFMFRYPGSMALEAFCGHVDNQTSMVTRRLAGVALPTTVGIKPARIFRNPNTQLDAVAQTQPLLALEINAELKPQLLHTLPPGHNTDKTVRDLEHLINGSAELVNQHGFYPDIADGSGNLRLNLLDGAVTLIDVMPFYESGSRLIGDAPLNVVSNIQQNLLAYEEFVGQYGG